MQAKRRLQALYAMTGLLLSACASLPNLPGLPPGEDKAEVQEQTEPTQPDRAGALRDELARIDTLPVPERQQSQLRLARRLIDEQRLDEARKLLQRTFVFNLAPEFRWRKTLTEASLELAGGRAAAALDLLRTPPSAPDDILAQWFDLRAQAYYAGGAWLNSLRERILRANHLDEDLDKRDNQQLIWQTLQRAAETGLPEPRAEENELRGWLELFRLWRDSRRFVASSRAALAAWRARYPDHPADPTLIQSWFADDEYRLDPQRPVALLLPLSGPHAKAAAAIRDGVLAAYFLAARPQPPLTIIDSTTDALAAYHQAVEDGAQLVIGPLRKEAVNALAMQPGLKVPVLALNHADPAQDDPATGEVTPPASKGDTATTPPATGRTTPNGILYQFGLNPEQEVEQISARAFSEGCHAPLGLVPGNPWGERMALALTRTWQHDEGRLLLVQHYNAKGNDFSHAIKSLLDIDDSERRKRALEATLGAKVKFEPRRRQDADCIIMAAQPRQARLIRPQLRFHYAAGLPVYATSHAYSGHLDPAADRDMNGLRIIASPWVLDNGQNGSQWLSARDREARGQLAGLWPDDFRKLTRFHALGVDAYHLAPLLERLRSQPEARYRGATGTLGIDATGRVRRELLWASFIRGIPRIVEHPEPAMAFRGSALPVPEDSRP